MELLFTKVTILCRYKYLATAFFFFFLISFCSIKGYGHATGKKTVSRLIKFNFNGQEFQENISLNYSDYIYYKRLSKTQSYSVYSSEDDGHQYLFIIAKILDSNAACFNFTKKQFINYLIAFVQEGIPYKDDPVNNGLDYPRYPIETIVDSGGDCEDKSALLVALLKTFGFDAVMMEINERHMAVGLADSNNLTKYVHNKKHYLYVETTAPGWKVGIVPKSEQGKAQIFTAPKVHCYKNLDSLISMLERVFLINQYPNRDSLNGNLPIINSGVLIVLLPKEAKEGRYSNSIRLYYVIGRNPNVGFFFIICYNDRKSH